MKFRLKNYKLNQKMNIEENKKSPIKFSMNEIKNLNDYLEHEGIIQCSACKFLAVNPFYCKSCKVSFCKNCMSELKIADCPYCKMNKLTDETLDFCNFFKDLCLKCSNCSELIFYPLLINHNCTNELIKSESTISSNINNNQDQDDIKYKDGIIHILCRSCMKYIPNPLYNNHECTNLNNLSSNTNLLQTNLNPNLANINNINKDNNPQINNLCNALSNQKLITIPNQENLTLSKKFSETNLENRINKLENVLADFISNFTNTFKSKPRMLDISTAINNLNLSIIELNKMNQFSYCNACKNPKKLGDLCPCPCKFCENNKKYCLDCIIVCYNCQTMMNKNCRFICSICKGTKCSFCEEQKEVSCLCSDSRVCSACHKFNIANNPNLSIRNFLYLKENHTDCRFVKSLNKNIFLVKFFQGNFKFNISLNSQKQLITIFLLKDKIDLVSKILQIGPNDTIRFSKINSKLTFTSNEDSWEMNLIYLENKQIDYIVFNFNLNQEKLNLNALENMDYNSLPNSNYNFTNVMVTNNILGERHIIKSLYFEKA